jgi:lysozyme family protein
MTVAIYRPALALVLAHEGGFVNHPKDPGGATNRGITQRVYDGFRRLKGLPARSVKYIEDVEVEAIYKRNYWGLVRGDELPAGVDYAVFDFAVNSGVSRAIKFLQAGLGFTGENVDGIIGDMTLGRVFEAAKANEELLITKYCGERMRFLKSLGTFPTFGKGWTRRVMGREDGVQANIDNGVIDYAVGFARRDPIYTAPAPIGSREGEVNGKGVPVAANDKAPAPISYTEAKVSSWGI